MKKLKLITAIIAVFMFSNLMLADNPNIETADNVSNSMVDNLNADVKLTSDQKIAIKMKSTEYALKLFQARAMSNKDESYIFMKTVTENYEAAIDSTLSSDQKILKEKKKAERIQSMVVILNSNK
jgi:hypothetical protein